MEEGEVRGDEQGLLGGFDREDEVEGEAVVQAEQEVFALEGAEARVVDVEGVDAGSEAEKFEGAIGMGEGGKLEAGAEMAKEEASGRNGSPGFVAEKTREFGLGSLGPGDGEEDAGEERVSCKHDTVMLTDSRFSQ